MIVYVICSKYIFNVCLCCIVVCIVVYNDIVIFYFKLVIKDIGIWFVIDSNEQFYNIKFFSGIIVCIFNMDFGYIYFVIEYFIQCMV